jgi:hypothetical protein
MMIILIYVQGYGDRTSRRVQGRARLRILKYRMYCRVLFIKEAKTARGKRTLLYKQSGSLIPRCCSALDLRKHFMQ